MTPQDASTNGRGTERTNGNGEAQLTLTDGAAEAPLGAWKDGYDSLTEIQRRAVDQVVRYRIADRDGEYQRVKADGFEWTRSSIGDVENLYPGVVDGAERAVREGRWLPPEIPEGVRERATTKHPTLRGVERPTGVETPIPTDADAGAPPTAGEETGAQALRYEGADHYHILLPDETLACETIRDGSESTVNAIRDAEAWFDLCPKCAKRYDPHAGLTDADYRERITEACDLPEGDDSRRFTVAQLKALDKEVGADGGDA